MAENIQTQVLENLNKCTYFCLQMDESTDIYLTVPNVYDTNNGIREVFYLLHKGDQSTGKCSLDAFVKHTSRCAMGRGKYIAVVMAAGAKGLISHKSGLVRLQEIMSNATSGNFFTSKISCIKSFTT